MKMSKLKRKGAPGNEMDLYPVFKEINRIRNGLKGVVTEGQDPILLSFQLIKKKEKLRAYCGGTPL